LKIAKPKFKATPKFINYFFNAIERECVKIASGTTVLGITLNNLNELEIPDLNIKEQNNIVQEIESCLSVADKMEESITQSLQQAEALKQSILKKAFEGRLI
jgi:type I restriction enzyme, S subunit